MAGTCWRDDRISSSLPEQGIFVGLHSDMCQRARSLLGSDFEDESEGAGCRNPEGSDLAAEEGYEVQEALSTMGHEEYDETVLCARS